MSSLGRPHLFWHQPLCLGIAQGVRCGAAEPAIGSLNPPAGPPKGRASLSGLGQTLPSPRTAPRRRREGRATSRSPLASRDSPPLSAWPAICFFFGCIGGGAAFKPQVCSPWCPRGCPKAKLGIYTQGLRVIFCAFLVGPIQPLPPYRLRGLPLGHVPGI